LVDFKIALLPESDHMLDGTVSANTVCSLMFESKYRDKSMNSPRWISAQTILIPLLLLVAMTCYGEAGAAQLRLTWTDNSNNEERFEIERKLRLIGTYAQIATVGPNITSYTDSGLADETIYCYRVRASNGDGNSAYSNDSCAFTPITPSGTTPLEGSPPSALGYPRF